MAPLIPYVHDAKQNGFDDVLWMLDDYIKEMTVLNVFVLWVNRFGKLEIVTPLPDGTIFNGITRQSIIELKDYIRDVTGAELKERHISIHEVKSAH
jgi:branched-subunit amino acid aminotransferase/4-amino-4-deoxychorismate lyase